MRENEIAAEAMGINTTRVKVMAFVIAAFFAGIGGALFAHEVGTTLNPRELGFQKSIDLVIMVVLGGMGSISGVVLAAIVLTILPELFRELLRLPHAGVRARADHRDDRAPAGPVRDPELWDLSWWRRYVAPRWRTFAGGWLIAKSAPLPAARTVPPPGEDDPR